MKTIISILIIFGALLSGCIGQAGPQKYYDAGNSSELILLPNGKYIMNEKGGSTDGTYQKVDDKIYLSAWWATYTFSILNNSAVMGEKGDIWIRT